MLDRTDNIPHLINMKVFEKVNCKSPTIAAPFTKVNLESSKRSGSHRSMLIIITIIIIAGKRLETCAKHSSPNVQRGEDEEDVWHHERHRWVGPFCQFFINISAVCCGCLTDVCSLFIAHLMLLKKMSGIMSGTVG